MTHLCDRLVLCLALVATPVLGGRAAGEAPVITGIAPGRLVPGEGRVVIYGRGLRGAIAELEGPVGVAGETERPMGEGRQTEPSRVALRGEVDESGSSLAFDVPGKTEPGIYRVSVRSGKLCSAPRWLYLEPHFLQPAPRLGPRAIARPLRSGQTVRERLVPRGVVSGGLWDYQIYYFATTAGSSIDVSLERVDRTRSWEHPEELDPEIYIGAPDGAVYGHLVGRDVRPGSDLNAAIRNVALSWTGLYFLVAGTTKGSGEYDLYFRLTPAPASVDDRSILLSNPMALILTGHSARSTFLLLDPRGYPISGAGVEFLLSREIRAAVEFVGGAASTTNMNGLVAATLRLDSPNMGAVAPNLYRCVLSDSFLASAPPASRRQVQVPRAPVAGSASGLVRDVDLKTGDLQLEGFSFQKD